MKEIKNLATVFSINLNTESHLADLEVEFSASDIRRLIAAACLQLPEQHKKVQADAKEFLKLTNRLFGSRPKISIMTKLHMNKNFLKEKNAYNV